MKNRSSIKRAVIGLLVAAVSAVGGCHEVDYVLDASPDEPIGPFGLTFTLDSSFQAAHGGQPIRIAVVQGDVVVAQTSGTVSATQNPSFTFAAGKVLMRGFTYKVQVWIDSNLGGGTPGLCDPIAVDHQWSTEFPWPTNDVRFTLTYQTWLMENVCSTFS